MNKLFYLVFLGCIAANTLAVPYYFHSLSGKNVWVDVEGWAGTGSNETILVVDWNKLDNGANTVSQSHAFGYRWDGVKKVSDMLTEMNAANIIKVTTGYGGAFLSNIEFADSQEPNKKHKHIEEGSWNLASTGDPDSNWGTWQDSEWDFNAGGMSQETLVSGQFEGINAIKFFGTLPSYADTKLDIPFAVPEPLTIALLGLGSLMLKRNKKVS